MGIRIRNPEGHPGHAGELESLRALLALPELQMRLLDQDFQAVMWIRIWPVSDLFGMVGILIWNNLSESEIGTFCADT